uniref:ATP synthase delta chain, chloroplastic-like n=1 Tax=Erigeron canadensis TaxID=72917 RepID=UPI001CB938A6|nr:ATP synthase delta chain, chloroplastic-like [Erigeron canadensis]
MAAAATIALLNSTLPYQSQSPRINQSNLSISSRTTLPNLSLKPKLKHHGGVKMTDSAAGRYASALADIANSKGTLKATLSDIEKIDKIFSIKPTFNFFTNPTIPETQKHKLIQEISISGFLQPYVCNLLSLLIEKNRMNLIREIVEEFEIVYNKLTDTELALVTSVVKIDQQNLAKIAKQVRRLSGARNVRIKTVIDESLVGGFSVKFGDSQSKLIDLSVRKQLEDIAAIQLQI